MYALNGLASFLSSPVLQMGMAEAIGTALNTIADPVNLLLIFIAVLFGMLLGVMPGLGGNVGLALLIPITFGMEPVVAFMLLAAMLGANNFGGSLTAILINTPGSSVNAATLLDGYPLSRQGRAGEAIGASAMASATGAIFGVLILILTIPILMEAVLLFGPPEIFWLGIWGLTVIPIVVRGSVLSGLIAAGFGVIFSIHGFNQFTATARWDYGLVFMQDGMPLVPALIGLFAVAQMIQLIAEGGTIATDNGDTSVGGGRWKGILSVIEHKWLFLRSAVIGTVVGLIPGVGGSAANYIAYFQAVQTTSDSDRYGTGDIRGVIAPEASNDAKDGGGFIPTLGLGVPGSSTMAVLLGGFILHGVNPGPLMFQEHLDIVWIIILTTVLSNLLTSGIGLVFANQLVKITRIDTRLLAPGVLAVAFLGSYATGNIFQIWVTLLFGILGFFMLKTEMSRIPLILGMVLGSIVEANFFRTLAVSGDRYGAFIGSPVAIFLILLVLVSLLLPWIRAAVHNNTLELSRLT